MTDSSKPDIDFTFLLSKEDGSVWNGAEYYLYDTSTGKIIEESENPYQTKENGTFTLKAGETAIFVGIVPGTICSVSEVGNPNYVQVLPTTIEGYKDYEVTDAQEVLIFSNEAVNNTGVLTVTKHVESAKGDVPENPEKDFFKFRLSRIYRDEAGNVSEEKPAGSKDYSVAGGTSRTGKTDENGIFSIRANETARFTALEYGEYKVEELSEEEQLPEGYWISDEERIKTEKLTKDSHVEFTFTNQYIADSIDLSMLKVNRTGDKTFENISFELRKGEEDGEVIETYTTDSEGKISIQNLASGTYYLKELQAATGYQVLEKPIKLEITRSTDRRQMEVKASIDGKGLEIGNVNSDGGESSVTEAEGDVSDPAQKIKELKLVKNDTGNDEIQVTVINDLLYSLPNSGGSGIFLYILSGIALMMAASYLYWKKCRKQIA